MARGQTRRAFVAALASLLSPAAAQSDGAEASRVCENGKPIRWVAFYGATADESVLASYDVVVLDRAFQGCIRLVAARGARVCGYVSLGEISTTDPELHALDRAALLDENPNWPGTRRADVRNPSWRSFILERRIPSLASQGFDGLMLDTLDTPPYLELLEPGRYQGMGKAAVDLVRSIRARWPRLMLIMNRGYALLPDAAMSIDAVIAESLLTSPDPATGGFTWADPAQVEQQLALLKPAALRRPPLPVLSLDYWDPDEVATIAEIYRRERVLHHHPYVATRLLDRIVPDADDGEATTDDR
jgi:polysaccharide biosynthesis protein PelA